MLSKHFSDKNDVLELTPTLINNYVSYNNYKTFSLSIETCTLLEIILRVPLISCTGAKETRVLRTFSIN